MGIEEKDQAAQDASEGKDTRTTEDGSTPSKSQSLLHVPSRSSSQRIQPSPTTTGLSGATASDPRDSIGGNSKDSSGSMSGRRRNGSASSNQSGMPTGPTDTAGNSQSGSPAGTSQRKKRGGGSFLSIFGCCGVPDDANGINATEQPLPSHKVDKIPLRPTTASRRPVTPSEQPPPSRPQTHEKEEPQSQPPQENTRNGNGASSSNRQDQSTVEDREGDSKQTTLVNPPHPVITVDPSLVTSTTEIGHVGAKKDVDGDVPMPDAGAAGKRLVQPTPESTYTPPPPPPPPGPIPAGPSPPLDTVETSSVFAAEQGQKSLLPPQAPEFRGKKCLVLDLDETLVHSSFKVSFARSIWFGLD